MQAPYSENGNTGQLFSIVTVFLPLGAAAKTPPDTDRRCKDRYSVVALHLKRPGYLPQAYHLTVKLSTLIAANSLRITKDRRCCEFVMPILSLPRRLVSYSRAVTAAFHKIR